MSEQNIHINHAENGGEIKIKIDEKLTKVDGFHKESNTVYEFNGDFFHGNPEFFESDEINPINKKTFGQLYQDTLEREQKIRNSGYNLVVIWENDFRKIERD